MFMVLLPLHLTTPLSHKALLCTLPNMRNLSHLSNSPYGFVDLEVVVWRQPPNGTIQCSIFQDISWDTAPHNSLLPHTTRNCCCVGCQCSRLVVSRSAAIFMGAMHGTAHPSDSYLLIPQKSVAAEGPHYDSTLPTPPSSEAGKTPARYQYGFTGESIGRSTVRLCVAWGAVQQRALF